MKTDKEEIIQAECSEERRIKNKGKELDQGQTKGKRGPKDINQNIMWNIKQEDVVEILKTLPSLG